MVELILENCEVFKFVDGDVTVELEGLGRHYYNKKEDFLRVNRCVIRIDKDAIPELDPLWGMPDWVDRLKRTPDIVAVVINGKTYYVAWGDEGGEYINSYQTFREDKYHYIIEIGKH